MGQLGSDQADSTPFVAAAGVLLLLGTFLLLRLSHAPKPAATSAAPPVVTPLPQPPAPPVGCVGTNRSQGSPNRRTNQPARSTRSGWTHSPTDSPPSPIPSPTGRPTSPGNPLLPDARPRKNCTRSCDHARNLPHPARDSRAKPRRRLEIHKPRHRRRHCLARAQSSTSKATSADALEKFQAAYAAFPSPKLMFNIRPSQSLISAGPFEALEAFEKFLVGAADAVA